MALRSYEDTVDVPQYSCMVGMCCSTTHKRNCLFMCYHECFAEIKNNTPNHEGQRPYADAVAMPLIEGRRPSPTLNRWREGEESCSPIGKCVGGPQGQNIFEPLSFLLLFSSCTKVRAVFRKIYGLAHTNGGLVRIQGSPGQI